MDKAYQDNGYFHSSAMVILHTLKDKDCYGYEIIKILERKSQGAFVLKEPTLYSVLKRLERATYLTSYWGDETNGARRRYYSLTEAGAEYVAALIQHWNNIKKINTQLLK